MLTLRSLCSGVAAAVCIAGTACGGGSSGGGGAEGGSSGGTVPEITLTAAFGGRSFDSPVKLVQHPTNADRWYVVEQDGLVKTFLASNTAAPTIAADVDAGEQGLLGMAFDPNFASSGEVYFSYIDAGAKKSVLARWVRDDPQGLSFSPDTSPIVLAIPHRFDDHDSGDVVFGPDGFLYYSMGDGGGDDDPDDNGQDRNALLGKILRIDVNSSPPAGMTYAIPPSNPFASNPQCNGNGTGSAPCPEIYALGMRNPWRMNFDPATGKLYVGDMGQDARDEIDIVVKGGNYGWDCFEGELTHGTSASCTGPFEPPEVVHGRSEAGAITGGVVYRGSAVPGLRGFYVYGDFLNGLFFAFDTSVVDAPAQRLVLPRTSVSAFGQGRDGEVYVVGFDTPSIQRIVPSSTVSQGGPLQIHPTNPRYFTDGSGKAIYVTGSHTWTNLNDQTNQNDPDVDLPIFDFSEYLDFLEDHNHNFIRLWASNYNVQRDPPYTHPRTGPGTALDGQPRFDLSQFDQSYFDRLRARVIAARDRGFYVSIMLFDGLHVALSQDWAREAYNEANNINGIDGDLNGDGNGGESYTLAIPALTLLQDAYVRKIIDTLNDLDNVLYEISNEAGPDSTAWQYHMINLIKAYESGKPKQHLVGMTFQAPGGSNQALFDSAADWISPNDADGYTSSPPVNTGSKVQLVDTDHLCGTCADRRWPWKNFLRGHNFLLMDPYYPSVSDASFEETRKAMGHTLTYASRMNLAAATPQPSLSTTGYVLANPGSEYLVYQSSSGPFTVTLQAGDYAYEWFNPSAGVVAQTGTVSAASGNRSFTPPFSGDAVLYLSRTAN